MRGGGVYDCAIDQNIVFNYVNNSKKYKKGEKFLWNY